MSQHLPPCAKNFYWQFQCSETNTGNKFSFFAVTFHGNNCWNFDFLGYKKRHRTWVVCDAPKSNMNFTEDVNNENLKLIPEHREENLNFYQRLLFCTHYFICVQFNNPASIWCPSNNRNFSYFPSYFCGKWEHKSKPT